MIQKKAVHFEITRQQSLVERKIPVISETRQWDEKRKITVSARTKEEEQDYRFFLEGDIPWVKLDSTHFEKLKEKMPKSIATKKLNMQNIYNLKQLIHQLLIHIGQT